MLVITRNEGERLRIITPEGRVIWVTFLQRNRLSGKQARLGIDADRDVVVTREELPPAEQRYEATKGVRR